MTSDSIKEALDALSSSVNQHRIELAEKMSVLTTEVKYLQTNYLEVNRKVSKIREEQLACPARNHDRGTESRLKSLEEHKHKKPSDPKINVAEVLAEFHRDREDQTGRVDEIALAAARAAQSEASKGNTLLVLAKNFGPWIAALLVVLGAYLGSGGDEERVLKVLKSVQAINAKVEALEEQIPKALEAETTLERDEGTHENQL